MRSGAKLGIASLSTGACEHIILKTAVKENENGADTRKHFRILKVLARNPGTVRVSTKNSKAKVISCRCAIFRPATAVFRIMPESLPSPVWGLGG